MQRAATSQSGRSRAANNRSVAAKVLLSPAELRLWDLEQQFLADLGKNSTQALTLWWVILVIVFVVIFEVHSVYLSYTAFPDLSESGPHPLRPRPSENFTYITRPGGELEFVARADVPDELAHSPLAWTWDPDPCPNCANPAGSVPSDICLFETRAFFTGQGSHNFTCGNVTSTDFVKQYNRKNGEIRLANLVKGCWIYPCLLFYLLVLGGNHYVVARCLRCCTAGQLASLIMILVLLGFTVQTYSSHRQYGYYFLVFLFVFNLLSVVKHVQQVTIAFFLCLLFIVIGYADLRDLKPESEDVLNPDNEYLVTHKWLTEFIFERVMPIIFISLVCNFSSERRLRKVFMKLRLIKAQKAQIKDGYSRAEFLLANSLPRPIIDILRSGKHPVIDSYGTILFADIVKFTVFSSSTPARVRVEPA